MMMEDWKLGEPDLPNNQMVVELVKQNESEFGEIRIF